MYQTDIEEKLENKLDRLRKKDKILVSRVIKKMEEILTNPEHYKPLRHDLKNVWRVQIGHFVLVFSINKKEKIVKFLDFDHHDTIYNKKF